LAKRHVAENENKVEIQKRTWVRLEKIQNTFCEFTLTLNLSLNIIIL